MDNYQQQAGLALGPGGSSLRLWAAVAAIAFLLTLVVAVVWITELSGLRFEGFSEFATIAVAYLLALLLVGVLAAIASWKLYFGPRARAFRNGDTTRIDVLAGKGQLVLWRPGETFIFLKNRQLAGVGSERGGTQVILPVLAEEAVGPISLKTELLPWTDKHVLTREAQAVEIDLGIWWRVAEPHQYAFRINSEIHREEDKVPTNFKARSDLASENTWIDPHRPAANWLHVWIESSVRSYVNRLGMSDVVSAQASKWLQLPSDAAARPVSNQSSFEQLEEVILQDVCPKAEEYGIAVEKVAVQGITLPKDIQSVIDRTRQAFLLPIQSEQQAEARYIELKRELEASRDVLGVGSFQLNELLKNFKGSSFGYFPQFLQTLFAAIDQKAAQAGTVAESSTGIVPKTPTEISKTVPSPTRD